MFNKIKELIKHSFIYSISNAALKASGVVLLPLYTSRFSVGEYGRLGLILITIIVLSQSLILGQGVSLTRYNNSKEFRDKRESLFFTLTIIVLALIAIFIFVFNHYLYELSSLLGDANEYSLYVRIAIYIVSAITLNNLFLSKLRADESSVLYTISFIVKIIVIILLNFYFILYKGMGIEGVLYAQLFGEIVNTIIILPRMLRGMEFKIEYRFIIKTIKFGFPLIFSAMAINLLNGSDRFIIKFLRGDNDLGLYELGYRIAGLMSMFVIIPFGMTLIPAAYKMYKKEGDKKYYTKLKTYAAFVFVWIGLVISLFSEELIRIFALNSSYYPAYSVVPLIVLAYIVYGISMVSSLGMYLTGKNHFVAYITIFCAGLNIGLNFILIPKYGIMGAAFNTVISFLILDGLSNLASNRYYKIKYEYHKIVKVFITGIILFLISRIFENFYLAYKLVIKVLLLIIFPIVILLNDYFDTQELSSIKGVLKKWTKLSNWRDIIIK